MFSILIIKSFISNLADSTLVAIEADDDAEAEAEAEAEADDTNEADKPFSFGCG
jgi:hypothetical protein